MTSRTPPPLIEPPAGAPSPEELFYGGIADLADPASAAAPGGGFVTLANERELAEFIWDTWGVRIPARRVCKHHRAPLEALAAAYFAEHPRIVWKASRTYGGKTVLLAALTLTEARCLGASCTLLGGSFLQSRRAHDYMQGQAGMAGRFWRWPAAPRSLLRSDPTQRATHLANGGLIEVLPASPKAIRGAHPQRLRGDELDEMEASIWDDATPMVKEDKDRGIIEQIVGSSTYHKANGTMARELREARANNWPIYEWCAPPSTRVVMGDGTVRPIEAIRTGDVVLAGDGQPQRVTATHVRHYAGLLVAARVEGLPDPLMLTPEHRLTSSREILGLAAGLVSGDEISVPIVRLRRGGDYDAGWIVGAWLAEGWLPERGRYNGVSFAVHEREAAELGARLRPFSVRPPHIRRLKGHGATVTVYDAGLRALIGHWGGGRDAASKALARLPEERVFAQGVVDGWLWGDAGQTASESLGWQMHRLAEALGRASSLWRGTNRPGPAGRAVGRPGAPFWRVTVSEYGAAIRRAHRAAAAAARELYRDGHTISALARLYCVKRDTIRRWVQAWWSPGRGQARVELGDHIWRRIASVQRVWYEGPVHDLTVDVAHTFLAAGVAVSNCYRETMGDDGFVSAREIERKRSAMTKRAFAVELELQEPNPEGLAIDSEAVEAAFRAELGEHPGEMGTRIVFEKPVAGAGYAHGVDWGRDQHTTVIWTNRTDVKPVRLVAFAKLGRVPYPVMEDAFERRRRRYPGPACYDKTGVGRGVEDHLEDATDSEGMDMVGIARTKLFQEWIRAVEYGEFEGPKIETAYRAHRYVTVDDLYGSGHPPDEFAAAALAWRATMGAPFIAR